MEALGDDGGSWLPPPLPAELNSFGAGVRHAVRSLKNAWMSPAQQQPQLRGEPSHGDLHAQHAHTHARPHRHRHTRTHKHRHTSCPAPTHVHGWGGCLAASSRPACSGEPTFGSSHGHRTALGWRHRCGCSSSTPTQRRGGRRHAWRVCVGVDAGTLRQRRHHRNHFLLLLFPFVTTVATTHSLLLRLLRRQTSALCGWRG